MLSRNNIVLLLLYVCITFSLFMSLALYVKPVPISDFLYYWMLSDSYQYYHKGGMIGLLYRPVKALSHAPYVAAVLVNFCCVALVLFCLFMVRERNTISNVVFFPVLTLFIILIAPLSPIVASDIPASCAFLIAIFSLSLMRGRNDRSMVAISIVAFFLCFSLRQIYMVVALAFVPMVLFYGRPLHAPREFSRGRRILFMGSGLFLAVVAVVIGIVLALFAEAQLKKQSQQAHMADTVIRTVIAAGHNIDDSGQLCGFWSAQSARIGRESAAMPLLSFIRQTQSATGYHKLPRLYLCKAIQLLSYSDWFSEWLGLSLVYRPDAELSKATGIPDDILDNYARHHAVERSDTESKNLAEFLGFYRNMMAVAGILIKSLNSIMLLYVLFRMPIRYLYIYVPSLILLLAHVFIFEVQARYAFLLWFLPPLLLMTIRIEDRGMKPQRAPAHA